MEVRKRHVASVGNVPGRFSATGVVENPTNASLVSEGLELYAAAEKSGFQNITELTNCLQIFIRASVAGEREATEWIQSFDATSALPPPTVAAIPPHLLRLLQWATIAGQEEREVWLVAEDMFQGMVGSRAAVIPRSGIEEAVINLLTSSSSDSSLHTSLEVTKSIKGLKTSVKMMLLFALDINHTEEVSVYMFCEAAVRYARGVLSHNDRTLTPQQQREFKEANILRKVTKYPLPTAHYYRRAMLKLIERRGVKWIWSSFPTKPICLLVLAYFLPMISPGFILTSIATVTFVAGFIAMCVSTLQIILAAEKISSFAEYSSVFQYFSKGDKKLDTKKPEVVLLGRSVVPCMAFTGAFCVTLLAFHISHVTLVPHEVICIVSAFCALCVFLQFQCYKSPLFLACSSTRLLPWLHAFLTVFRAFVPDFLLSLVAASISIPVPGLFVFKLNIFTLVQFPVQCLLIVYFLSRNLWRDVYMSLGPYILFTSWWVTTRHFFVVSSPYYLFLGTFGVVMLLAISPFLPLLLVGSPVVVLYFYGFSRVFFLYAGLIVCFVVVLLFLGKYSRRLMEAQWLNVSFDTIVLLQLLVSIPAMLVAASTVARYYTPSNVPMVTVDQYREYCGSHIWALEGHNNMIETQLSCLHLKDRILSGSGLVTSVRIQDITNDRETGLKPFPGIVRAALTCLLGTREPMCGQQSDTETCKRQFTSCHFQHTNKYLFAIEMQLNLYSSSEKRTESMATKLLASNSFSEPIKKLYSGHEIVFNATFVSGMGTDGLVLQLVDLKGFTAGRAQEMEDSVHVLAYRVMLSIANTISVLSDVLLGYTAT